MWGGWDGLVVDRRDVGCGRWREGVGKWDRWDVGVVGGERVV